MAQQQHTNKEHTNKEHINKAAESHKNTVSDTTLKAFPTLRLKH